MESLVYGSITEQETSAVAKWLADVKTKFDVKNRMLDLERSLPNSLV